MGWLQSLSLIGGQALDQRIDARACRMEPGTQRIALLGERCDLLGELGIDALQFFMLGQ